MHRFALLLYSLGAGTAALTGDLTLTLGTNTGTAPSPMFQLRDPNGSNRNVLLPLLTGTQSESTGIWYFIRNTGSANNLVVKDSTGVTTYATLAPGQWCWMLSSGTTATWQVVASLADLVSLTLAGTLAALVVSTDTISEQTSAAGVTVDGVLCKDNSVTVGTGGQVTTNTIAEKTSAAGVTVDGCLIKDGRAALLATAGMFSSTEQTGTGSSQNVAHGFGAAPSMWWAVPTDTTAGWVVSAASQDATNISITVTTGAKFRVYALK